jgi:hypothetical protein
MITQFQVTELAILTVTKARQRGVTIDYRGIREETTRASPNDVANLVDKYVSVKGASKYGDKKRSSSSKFKSSSSISFRGKNNNNNNTDNCRKCAEENKTVLFSKCSKHNKRLSGNASAAPQH